jgi:hypothetical protein
MRKRTSAELLAFCQALDGCVHHLNARPASAAWDRIDADEIEQRIIRAYVQLACTPAETDGSRTVIVARLGELEARLTESPAGSKASGMPLFWLEVYSSVTHSVIDSCGCTEFDESEMAATVELIANAWQRAQGLH